MIPRLSTSTSLRFSWLLALLFGAFGRTLPAAAGPVEGTVLQATAAKPVWSSPALSDHLEALPADVLVWSSGLGIVTGPASAGLLPAMPTALLCSVGGRCLLPYVRPVAYACLIQARLLRTTLSPNAP
ncbi:hypothetical protein [Hymenobacter volaticus]|uniref:Uncharacterized protein n=1 Tax=Hymenobacter volaticus TaxID=2932254 RepID=A0ABY4GFR7_9BACT|nr:hypothetical protein [Hymenobacter volaticus]UOQ69671.1 hypothetical protein MUN86_29030 [Hymenobacter volaticus]